MAEFGGIAGWVVDVVGALGAVGVGVLVAAENIFPPIPSEVVLPVAGYVASQGRMSVLSVIVAATVGSLVGALALHYAGAKIGRARLDPLFDRLPLLEVADLDRAQMWFARHGGRAVLIGRCVPVVRSLVSIPAGVAGMPMRTFVPYTLLGSGIWNSIFILAGYELGAHWENVAEYSDVLNAVILVSIGVVIARFVIRRLRRRPS